MPTLGSFQGRGSYLSLCRTRFFTTEKRDVSSADSFTLHDTFSGRSLMYTRKDNGPSTDPWGTPADTVDQLEDFPLNATSCLRSCKKSLTIPRRLPPMPLHSSLYDRPSCHTLSNALDKSRETAQFSLLGLQSQHRLYALLTTIC